MSDNLLPTDPVTLQKAFDYAERLLEEAGQVVAEMTQESEAVTETTTDPEQVDLATAVPVSDEAQ